MRGAPIFIRDIFIKGTAMSIEWHPQMGGTGRTDGTDWTAQTGWDGQTDGLHGCKETLFNQTHHVS